MPIKLQCSNCRQPLAIPDNLAGRTVNCPKCKKPLTVPGARPAPAPAAAPETPEDDLALNIPGHGKKAATDDTAYKRCPGCGRDVESSVKLCTGCGYNFETGQTMKGHVIREPDAWKRKAEAVLRNGFFLVVLVVGAYGVYYVVTKTDFLKDIKKNPTEHQQDDPNGAQTPGGGAAADAPQSLLVISNSRFPVLTVFVNGEKNTNVQIGKTEKVYLPADKAAKLSFEAKFPSGVNVDDATKQALANGLTFGGTTTDGTRLDFKGPKSDEVPAVGDPLKGLIIGVHISRDPATGLGFCKEIPYKGAALKPVPPATALRVTWKDSVNGPGFSWIAQDCVVEKDGKPAYTPPMPPFEATKVKIETKNGRVDVKA
jgi:hypothetical protein